MFDIIQWCVIVAVLLVSVGIVVMTLLPYPQRRPAGTKTLVSFGNQIERNG